jgi:hypothetical protein
MTRFWLLALLAVSGVAHADSGDLMNGASLTFTMRTWLHEDNSQENQLPKQDPQSTWQYFNLAHCQCSQFNYSDPTATLGVPWFEGNFNPELQFQNPGAPISQPVEVWTGSSCDVDTSRPLMCHAVTSADIADAQAIATMGGLTTISVPLFDLIAPVPVNGARTCEGTAKSGSVWLLAKTTGGNYDFFRSKSYDIDTQPPFSPTAYTVTGGEGAIQIDFTPSTNNPSDIAYYQALCATESNSAAFTTPPFKPRYQTGHTLCNAQANIALKQVILDDDGKGTLGDTSTPTVDAGVDAENFAGPDAGIDAPEDAGVDADVDASMEPEPDANMGGIDVDVFGEQDAAFICGENPVPAATNLRITGLKNGTSYKVALLTIDKAGNASGVYFSHLITPQAVTDFWEDLHDNGSHVEGGFCLIAETYGDDNPLTNMLRRFRDDTLGGSGLGRALSRAYYATLGKLGVYVHGHLVLRIIAGILLLPVVVFALLWHLLTLPGLAILLALAVMMRRRALRLRMAQASAVALVLLVASRAHAQSPYWEDPSHTSESEQQLSDFDETGEVKWHVGVRAGPYIPGIDDQIGTKNSQGKGPYQAMFGGYNIVPMLDVDRVLWDRLGQLGAGISIGYLGKSAKAFQTTPIAGTTDIFPRAPGDTNSFHLIPLALSAVYRFTYPDDEYGIPLIPYVRAGLGYYIWWVTAPNGDFASVCKDGGMSPCEKDTAAGASLGFVGSIGLSLRAERIDAAAARSMRESGIEHAGFYAELSYGKVDGFGSSTKLSVGDTTWFAGAEFEF